MSFVDVYTDFIFIENQPEQADMIFLPGSAEGALPVRAAQLWKEGYAPLVLPSGKYSKLTGYFTGHGDHETEWDYFHEILLKEGVADHAILQEKQATYTYENAIYSKKVTDKEGMEVKKAILCCMPYHARRALLYYQLLYPETEFFVCPAKESPITAENWYLSKEGIETVLGEVERCGSQFHEILNEIKKEVRS